VYDKLLKPRQSFRITLYNASVKHKKNFNTLFYYLGQHVSTLIESSSGPSMIQILSNNIINALLVTIYILEEPEDDSTRVETCLK